MTLTTFKGRCSMCGYDHGEYGFGAARQSPQAESSGGSGAMPVAWREGERRSMIAYAAKLSTDPALADVESPRILEAVLRVGIPFSVPPHPAPAEGMAVPDARLVELAQAWNNLDDHYGEPQQHEFCNKDAYFQAEAAWGRMVLAVLDLAGIERQGQPSSPPAPTRRMSMTWSPIATAPKDGTLLLLRVEYDPDELSAHPLETVAEPTPDGLGLTIGFNNFDNDGVDEWKLAGWDWDQDAFTEGRGAPKLWMLPPINGVRK